MNLENRRSRANTQDAPRESVELRQEQVQNILRNELREAESEAVRVEEELGNVRAEYDEKLRQEAQAAAQLREAQESFLRQALARSAEDVDKVRAEQETKLQEATAQSGRAAASMQACKDALAAFREREGEYKYERNKYKALAQTLLTKFQFLEPGASCSSVTSGDCHSSWRPIGDGLYERCHNPNWRTGSRSCADTSVTTRALRIDGAAKEAIQNLTGDF